MTLAEARREGGFVVSFVGVVDSGGAHAAWRRIVCLGGYYTWMVPMTRGVTTHSTTMIVWCNIPAAIDSGMFRSDCATFTLLANSKQVSSPCLP